MNKPNGEKFLLQQKDETMRKNPSVFTKGQVYDTLTALGNEMTAAKSVKEARGKLDELIRQFTPQDRGRRKHVDFALLQSKVDEAYSRDNKVGASSLACMASSLYNGEGENYKNGLDSLNVRNYVEKGKITFPQGVVFTPRQKREKVTAVSTDVTND